MTSQMQDKELKAIDSRHDGGLLFPTEAFPLHRTHLQHWHLYDKFAEQFPEESWRYTSFVRLK